MEQLPPLSQEIINEITAQYADPEQDKHLHQLADGRYVIGYYVDPENHLYYVIRSEDTSVAVGLAVNYRVADLMIMNFNSQQIMNVTMNEDGSLTTTPATDSASSPESQQ